MLAILQHDTPLYPDAPARIGDVPNHTQEMQG
jgi:hypothetical protein